MKWSFKQFSEEYSLDIERKIADGDSNRSSNNPILFVFIGDKVKEGSNIINNNIIKKWDNGKDVVYLNILSENVKDEEDNIFNFMLPCNIDDNKKLRKSIKEKLYNDKELLFSLNKKLSEVRDRILKGGKSFNSFENISVSIILRADDPMNIILPEISILIKEKMMEAFKLCLIDLYILLNEKSESDEFFNSAVSYSIFREIEYIQNDNFDFCEKIDVYGAQREINVTFKGPIFYMTYILSDKNEKGIIAENSIEHNYEIISFITLLKNRNFNNENYSDMENQYYDNTRFKVNINFDNSKNVYATAGLAKVKRPNNVIAIVTTKLVLDNIVEKMNSFSTRSEDFIVNLLKLDENYLENKIQDLIPKEIILNDMMSIMSKNSSFVAKNLTRLTYREIEDNLYDEGLKLFFYDNFEKKIIARYNKEKSYKEMINLINNEIVDNKDLGIFCAYNWTLENGIIRIYLKKQVNFYEGCIKDIEKEIENIYEMLPPSNGFNLKKLFSKNEDVECAKKGLFNSIYGRKLEIAKIRMKIRILKDYDNAICEMNTKVSNKIAVIGELQKNLNIYINELIKNQDEYTTQNIEEYYSDCVYKIMNKLEEINGEKFYFEDGKIGNINVLLSNGQEDLFNALSVFCNKYILSCEEFSKSFEEEFNERANINITHWNNKILSKDELYKNLYSILDENSSLKIYIMNYDVKSYAEKYFFGDYSSDFIKYAFEFDRKSRNYKIGYVHEKRTSGIEKLNLMGGFLAKDLIYLKHAKKLYDFCLENGYELHGIDLKTLPEL